MTTIFKCTDAESVEERFWANVVVGGPDDCWPWVGSKISTHGNDYGVFSIPTGKEHGKSVSAHRYSCELAHGPIPEGYVVDHKCRFGLCVNPNHLEAVTNKENILRGNGAPAINARKTHCVRGHPLSGSNLRPRKDGRRVCIICDKARKIK